MAESEVRGVADESGVGGAVVGGGVITIGAPLHSVTLLCVAPGIGCISSTSCWGEVGPDRGRFGSVNTTLNNPRCWGM